MTNADKPPDLQIQARILLLNEFRDLAQRWFDSEYGPEDSRELRRQINRLIVPARQAVQEAGAMKLVTISPPPAVGGLVVRDADPFRNFFESFWGQSIVPTVIDAVDEAIGVYECVADGSDLVSLGRKEAFDIEKAIERALRPSFRNASPEKEVEVQDAIETILNALGVDSVREKEVVVTGPRASRPDFSVAELELAIEVKLAKKGHGPSPIQEEINADIAAYKCKWRRLLFVIYDLGVIDDPHRMIQENQRLFGVAVLIVKH
jgi:DpnII restriction endonuclease